jgi:hypothetical protein
MRAGRKLQIRAAHRACSQFQTALEAELGKLGF